MIKLTIVVAAYNVENYINQCIDSLLSQTLDEMEIIIINDGSKDLTLNKIKKYSDEEKVKIIDQNNGGVGNVRNVGIANANGKYITFVDGDDFLINNEAYKDLISKLEKNNELEIITGGYKYIVENKVEEGSLDISLGCFKGRDYLLEALSEKKFSVVGWTKHYSLDLLKRNKLKFDESEIINQDHKFNIKACYLANKVMGTNIVFYGYRIHDNSVTHERSNCNIRKFKKVKSYLSCASGVSEFFEKNHEKNHILKKYQFENYLRVFSKISFYRLSKSQKKEIFQFFKEKELLKDLRRNINSLKSLFYYILIRTSPDLYYKLKYIRRKN